MQAQNTEAHQGNYAAGNLIWNPFGSLTVGGEFLSGWRDKDGSTGNAPRIQFSAKYNFVRTQSGHFHEKAALSTLGYARVVRRPVLADLATIQTVLAATIPTRTDSGRNHTTGASSKVPYKQRTTSST